MEKSENMIEFTHEDIQKELSDLLDEMNIDCYLTFTADCHLNEYVGESDELLSILTGFFGSNGVAFTFSTTFLKENPNIKNLLWTDGRYFLQAQNESKYELRKKKVSIIFQEELKDKVKTVALDKSRVPHKYFKTMQSLLEEIKIGIVPVGENLIVKSINNLIQKNNKDENNNQKELSECKLSLKNLLTQKTTVFDMRRNCGDIIYLENYKLMDFVENVKVLDHIRSYGLNVFDDEIMLKNNLINNVTGSSYQNKIERVRNVIKDDILVVSALDTICWILNVRGADIEYNPVFFAYLIVSSTKVILFTDVEIYLKDVEVKKYDEFYKFLKDELAEEKHRIIISEDSNAELVEKIESINAKNNFAVEAELNQPESIFTPEIKQMQSIKNDMELAGMVLSYFYDGIALCNTLGEIERKLKENKILTEKDCSDILLGHKKGFNAFVQPSFETISCTGANCAIIHHRPSDAVVKLNECYLIDSGSQYFFGTTDTTRTCLFSDVSAFLNELQHDYTLVLKGHVSIMMKEYELEDMYAEIDARSRSFLREEEKDFAHSVSHGVGHFLNVHECPPSVNRLSKDKIQANVVISNEPGYYLEGKYGIRIENLIFSKETEEGKKYFNNFTTVPYDVDLIEKSMLSNEEIQFINEIHEKTYELLKEHVNEDGLVYLKKHTRKISNK